MSSFHQQQRYHHDAITFLTSAALILLGAAGYLGSDSKSFTALIPSFFGIALGLAAIVASKDSWRSFGMHAGRWYFDIGGTPWIWPRFVKIGTLFSDDPDVNRRAVWFVLGMASICLVHVILSVRSFIAARKKMKSQPDA